MTRALQPSSTPVPRRSDLARALRISVGGFANPDVFALEHAGAKQVVKEYCRSRCN